MEEWIHTRKDQEGYEEQVGVICELYREAEAFESQGIHVFSVDEKTGIQALERKASTPMKSHQVARQDNEYTRHGTQCLIANLEVATGHIVESTVQATRTEKDFAAPRPSRFPSRLIVRSRTAANQPLWIDASVPSD